MQRPPELQEEFAEALLQPGNPVPAGVVGPNGKAAEKRFAVYRNNVAVSLTAALKSIFPAISALVGEEYFAALAREFIRRHPPSSSILADYGRDFGDFLDAFPPLANYPYLGDAARLERAWLDAYHAADATPLDAGELGSVPQERLGSTRIDLHPSARIVRSRWPVATIVEANRSGGAMPNLSAAGGEDVLVSRPALDVIVTRLAPGEAAFLAALGAGEALESAIASAFDGAASFDLASCLQRCLSTGAFLRLLPPA
ncbi:putative DNA-binding domain-containing protein [Stappia sp. F7233]|uniref:Putative DNA-binding domain-containing protein n=1 Tax=Stappia albiluteola TaxID=2758565 RepID=A0A839ADX1_9HYPH|nr:DNA-binding domain-containing protein [Stappia albiluteola]MBA5777335.1 putative DNA-binding domain-containing protein [Stappia albiluteola]